MNDDIPWRKPILKGFAPVTARKANARSRQRNYDRSIRNGEDEKQLSTQTGAQRVLTLWDKIKLNFGELAAFLESREQTSSSATKLFGSRQTFFRYSALAGELF